MAADPSTTFRLTTPPGRGGIAVIELAGPRAAQMVRAMFRPWKSHAADTPNSLRLGNIVDTAAAQSPLPQVQAGQALGERAIDEAVVCRRGEVYEINIHGGPLVARQTMHLLERLGALDQDKVARNEEAAAAGLTAAAQVFDGRHPKWNNLAVGREMLSLLAQARSELVVLLLSSQWSGGLSELCAEAMEEAHVPSAADGGHGPATATAHAPATAQEHGTPMGEFGARLARAAGRLEVARRLLVPAEVVLIGPPNAGKSTLANALVGRQVSIVHEQPGTTRDYVRELALLHGVPVWLTDTAGLWGEAIGVDAQAVERARRQALGADVILLCAEIGECPSGGRPPVDLPRVLNGKPCVRVATKCDRASQKFSGADVRVSAHTGAGLDDLKTAVLQALGLHDLDVTEPTPFTPRQQSLLQEAAEATDLPFRRRALRALLEG